MTKMAVILAKIDADVKHNAEQVFRKLGLTPTQAITLFYKQVGLQHGLPFRVKVPNEVTKKALEDAREHRNLESFDSLESLFEDLGI